MSGQGEAGPTREEDLGRREGETSPAMEQENIGDEQSANPASYLRSNSNARLTLAGWPLIEAWMSGLDKGMVSDFHEDINTLLTFAGLFSAVVTAFLIQLYLGLQPDNSQATNNLLAQISLQLGQISQQLMDSNIVPVSIPTPSPSFRASPSVIWINTLWFLSLVLSLAAALFGMISKQWLREYLLWTTMSGPSQNQVALRQGRWEAFMDWKTPAIISSMPVLLELALIIFLLGLEVLLWTLNNIVFWICTVAIATLIALVVVVTVLPVFRARCPYKSPVGWAFVLAKAVLYSWLRRTMFRIERILQDLTISTTFYSDTINHLRPRLAIAKDWRERDLAEQMLSLSGWENEAEAAAVGQHQLLTRALWWIQDNSQDQRLIRAVDECVAAFATSNQSIAMGALAADFRFACKVLHINPTELVPPEDQCAIVDGADRVVGVGPYFPWAIYYQIKLARDDAWEERSPLVNAPPSTCERITHLLSSDLLAVIADYNAGTGSMRRFGNQAAYYLQMSVLLSGWLAFRVIFHEMCLSEVATSSLVKLCDRLCRNYAELPSPLKPLLPPLLACLDECKWRLLYPPTSPPARDSLRIRHMFATPPGSADNWSKTDCSVFVHTSQFTLRGWYATHDHDATTVLLPPLFDRMTACVRRCHEQQWRDCTVPVHEFLWLARLKELFGPVNSDISGQHLPADLFPHSLVDALQRYGNSGLISNSNDLDAIVAAAPLSIATVSQYTSQQGRHAINNLTMRHTSSSSLRPIYGDTAQASMVNDDAGVEVSTQNPFGTISLKDDDTGLSGHNGRRDELELVKIHNAGGDHDKPEAESVQGHRHDPSESDGNIYAVIHTDET